MPKMGQKAMKTEKTEKPNRTVKASDSENRKTEPKLYTTYINNLPSGTGVEEGGRKTTPPYYYPVPPKGSRVIREEKTETEKAVEFFHQCTPPTATAQTRRHTGKVSYLPAATKRAAAMLQAIMEPHAPIEPLGGPLAVVLYWTYPHVRQGQETPVPKTTRPDLDNLAKLALDAMTKAGYWIDDAQVCDFSTMKFTGPLPGIYVMVQEAPR